MQDNMASPHSTSAYDHLIKILLVGDAGTNKRALLAKYIGDEDLSDTTTLGELYQTIYFSFILVERERQRERQRERDREREKERICI